MARRYDARSRRRALRRTGDLHQPGGEGRQGRPRLVRRAGRRGRRRGTRRRRLRQGEGGPAAIAKGVELGRRKMFEVPMMGRRSARDRGPGRRRPRAAEAGGSRDRRDRRGPVRAGRGRGDQGHPVQVDGLLEPDQHREGRGRGPEGLRKPHEVAAMRGREAHQVAQADARGRRGGRGARAGARAEALTEVYGDQA